MGQAFSVVEKDLISLIDHHVVVVAYLISKLTARVVDNKLNICT